MDVQPIAIKFYHPALRLEPKPRPPIGPPGIRNARLGRDVQQSDQPLPVGRAARLRILGIVAQPYGMKTAQLAIQRDLKG